MEHVTSKSFQRTLDSVRLPIQHFIDTGLWNPHAAVGWQDPDVSEQMVRGKCRLVAKELKRPFIRAHEVWSSSIFNAKTGWVRHKQPIYKCSVIEVPKRKKLLPLVSPMLLAANGKDVRDNSGVTLWSFRINNRAIWDHYYQFILTDPVCRKARGLPPVTE